MDVVFDLGGVVVTYDPPTIVSSFFDDPQEQTLVLSGLFAHPDWVELDRGCLTPEEAAERAAGRTGIAAARLYALLDGMPRTLAPIRETLELVSDVRRAGNRLLVLSNVHRASLAYLESAYDLFSHFDGRVVSCEVGACKPEAAIYRRLLDEYALDPPETVFIDDAQENLDAAAALGIRTIGFRDAASCRAGLRALGCL